MTKTLTPTGLTRKIQTLSITDERESPHSMESGIASLSSEYFTTSQSLASSSPRPKVEGSQLLNAPELDNTHASHSFGMPIIAEMKCPSSTVLQVPADNPSPVTVPAIVSTADTAQDNPTNSFKSSVDNPLTDPPGRFKVPLNVKAERKFSREKNKKRIAARLAYELIRRGFPDKDGDT
jgi:hypothetical protein